jgi:hypothetical protein
MVVVEETLDRVIFGKGKVECFIHAVLDGERFGAVDEILLLVNEQWWGVVVGLAKVFGVRMRTRRVLSGSR